ncbi:hypothetical protein [Thiobacillus sedimenti]|uniref:DUF4124 domain-containing protein n=1 Tax=Thiobacillus sedimenti TaxID=3110231 RepID=A0ABZ1CMN4_9PROT|nr:hypothetical protein [Thiobacillus sp. SCUT-2]WRS40681.1 hypothetical protein VA613_07315 [Thiobacillus sp. SCUT-2]
MNARLSRRIRRSMVLACAVIGALSLASASADEPFYRCSVNGKTVYTDKPCDAPTLPGASGQNAAAAGPGGKSAASITLDYTTPYGVWRGQAQYQAAVKGQPVAEAHGVVPLVVQVDKAGKVQGASPENGCTLLGVAAPYLTPNMLTLDVTLAGCRYTAYNRRYSGTLALYPSRNSVQFSLHASIVGLATFGSSPTFFDIKATMRR